MTPDEKQQFEKLKKDYEDLANEVYRNNFSAFQEFNKKSSFTGGLKVPHYEIVPTTGEVGELLESGGKLYICSTPNSFAVVGTQS